MTTAKTLEKLIVATMSGGDPNGLDGRSVIWTDLQRVDGCWSVLVADARIALEQADLTGASVVSIDQWDGSPFGDGNIGTVESKELGVLVCKHSEFCGQLPSHWSMSVAE